MKNARYRHIAELRRQQDAARLRATTAAPPPVPAEAPERRTDSGARMYYCPERRVMAARVRALRNPETWHDRERADRLAALLHAQIVLLREAWQGDLHGYDEARAVHDTLMQALRLYHALDRRARRHGWWA